MPNVDGFEFLKRARRYFDFPVLLLTAKSETAQKIKGFELGAELIMRVRALLKRYRIAYAQSVQVGGLSVDRNRHAILFDGTAMDIPLEKKYLLATYELSLWAASARVADIAQMLDVSKPSACRAIHVLTVKGYIERLPNREVTMTRRGTERAEEILHNRSILKRFFTEVLGVSSKMADADVPLMEYSVGVQAFRLFENILAPKEGPLALESAFQWHPCYGEITPRCAVVPAQKSLGRAAAL